MTAYTRTYALPHGYSAEFCHSPGTPFEVRWLPDVPRIHKPRQRRKFFEAYQTARREFLGEVAAAIGGNVLVVDTDNNFTSEVILAPTKH